MSILFYDTSSLLENVDVLFTTQKTKDFVISSITLQELESIKTANYKDEEIKQKARHLTHLLIQNQDKFSVWIFKMSMLNPVIELGLEVNNDTKILACAIDYDKNVAPDETVLVTEDLCFKNIANLFFGEDSIISVRDNYEEDNYTGYKELILTDEQLCQLYSEPKINDLGLLNNEYLIVKNHENEVIDCRKWTEADGFKPIAHKNFYSMNFGAIKPMQGDIYQALAVDTLVTNQISMISGKPGSGKTYLALGYLFSLLDSHQIEKIVIFCNPVVAKNAAKLGYYKGTAIEKMLQTQAGMVLSSKLGSIIEVEKLIEEEKIVLISAGDARGYEVPEHCGVYIMESQNLTIDLLRLLLQRISDTCKVIVDGDYNEQVDMSVYAGSNNGMRKMSEVFRGSDLYGQVELKKIHRSKIADIADNMR